MSVGIFDVETIGRSSSASVSEHLKITGWWPKSFPLPIPSTANFVCIRRYSYCPFGVTNDVYFIESTLTLKYFFSSKYSMMISVPSMTCRPQRLSTRFSISLIFFHKPVCCRYSTIIRALMLPILKRPLPSLN